MAEEGPAGLGSRYWFWQANGLGGGSFLRPAATCNHPPGAKILPLILLPYVLLLMISPSIRALCGMATGTLLLAAPAATAQAPHSPDSTAAAAVRSAREGSGTLVKLGVNVTRGAGLGGYSGLALPLVLSAEHHLTPATSVYGSVYGSYQVGRRFYFDGHPSPRLATWGVEAGIRHYYNQEKRRAKGRATGPFVGNYLALQTRTAFHARGLEPSYQYTNLALLWGMQRRLGKYGWLDAYVGGGIGRERTSNSTRSRFGFTPEIGVKFSLGSRLTH